MLTDTFASKVAAVGDEYADSSIGNVTGSNAVNVFLGIGVAWTIAAIYHAIKGTTFVVCFKNAHNDCNVKSTKSTVFQEDYVSQQLLITSSRRA